MFRNTSLEQFCDKTNLDIYRHNLAKFHKFQNNMSRCGSDIVRENIDFQYEGVHQVIKYRCMNRLCSKFACMRKRQKRIRNILAQTIPNMYNLYMVTLTYKGRYAYTDDIKPKLDHFYNDFIRKLKREKVLLGGHIKATEFTVNQYGVYYHIHAVISMKRVYKYTLQAWWYKITGDSYIVHPEKVHDKKGAISYLTKYLSKSIYSQFSELDWFKRFYGQKFYSVVGVKRSKPKDIYVTELGYYVTVEYPSQPFIENLTYDEILDLYELIP